MINKIEEVSMVNKKIAVVLLSSCLLLGALGGGFIAYRSSQSRPLDPANPATIIVEIPVGSGAAAVGQILEEAGIVRSGVAFVRACKAAHLDSSLRAGFYALSPSWDAPTIAALIAAGEVKQNRFTIPEGYTVQQIGERLAAQDLVKPDIWNSTLAGFFPEYDFLPPGQSAGRFEGYLFPDTYFVNPEAGAREIVTLMLNQFRRVWEEEGFAADAAALGMTRHEALTVASLLEREAMRTEEMPRIAGVIYNRLEAGMLLQIDATVLFALKEHKSTVTLNDLKVDSPYNTYLYTGLPPGPIASPGRAAIAAALHPEQHDYLYYMAVGDGTHEFNQTYAGHLQAKYRYEHRN